MGALLLVHVRTHPLEESWALIERYHVYQADALQVATAKAVGAERVVVSDKRLHEVVQREGLNSVYVG